MPVWMNRPDVEWDDVSCTTTVVVDVARGSYDDRAGTVLEAPLLAPG
jgi:hypothetical protein